MCVLCVCEKRVIVFCEWESDGLSGVSSVGDYLWIAVSVVFEGEVV